MIYNKYHLSQRVLFFYCVLPVFLFVPGIEWYSKLFTKVSQQKTSWLFIFIDIVAPLFQDRAKAVFKLVFLRN